ncbi:hypothetical protein BJ322DRAFT_706583 [Thelephora terrestris]|uniref:rRNA-processing protein n=1 Tax=Thelephora terrestris TaxID=56493 RepID=A0A9P6HI18_9AGAM|nr:hypothetical protein BJ322DRAFT_706583 [Thelephora terrestris]
MADTIPISLQSSAAGKSSGKGWKDQKTPTVRSQQSEGHKTKWQERMNKTKKDLAVKKLQQELRQEKEDERRRKREITKERRLAAEEKKRLEEDKAKMGTRKAERLRRKAGRTKKINH